jgi:hypothetical protein
MTESWPQPYRDITGTDRTQDDLLSLTEPAMHRRMALLNDALELWKSVLNGGLTESGRDLYLRMTKPEIGDLVIETIGMRYPARRDTQGDVRAVTCFGILLGIRIEWACTDEDWLRYQEEAAADGYPMPDDARTTTEAAYVQYGPSAADICRWTNCSLIAPPVDRLYHAGGRQP